MSSLRLKRVQSHPPQRLIFHRKPVRWRRSLLTALFGLASGNAGCSVISTWDSRRVPVRDVYVDPGAAGPPLAVRGTPNSEELNALVRALRGQPLLIRAGFLKDRPHEPPLRLFILDRDPFWNKYYYDILGQRRIASPSEMEALHRQQLEVRTGILQGYYDTRTNQLNMRRIGGAQVLEEGSAHEAGHYVDDILQPDQVFFRTLPRCFSTENFPLLQHHVHQRLLQARATLNPECQDAADLVIKTVIAGDTPSVGGLSIVDFVDPGVKAKVLSHFSNYLAPVPALRWDNVFSKVVLREYWAECWGLYCLDGAYRAELKKRDPRMHEAIQRLYDELDHADGDFERAKRLFLETLSAS